MERLVFSLTQRNFIYRRRPDYSRTDFGKYMGFFCLYGGMRLVTSPHSSQASIQPWRRASSRWEFSRHLHWRTWSKSPSVGRTMDHWLERWLHAKYAPQIPTSDLLVVFHVATLMPNREGDPQFTNKKLHIGNDYVHIVYNDSNQAYALDTLSVCRL